MTLVCRGILTSETGLMEHTVYCNITATARLVSQVRSR